MRELYESMSDWWERYENPIWRGSIHRIESQFGGAYASYFIFLRWLFLLNLGLSLFYAVLVVAIGIADTDWSTIATDFIPYLPAWVRQRTTAWKHCVGHAVTDACNLVALAWRRRSGAPRHRSSLWAGTTRSCWTARTTWTSRTLPQ